MWSKNICLPYSSCSDREGWEAEHQAANGRLLTKLTATFNVAMLYVAMYVYKYISNVVAGSVIYGVIYR